jgi:hypothetical protein
MAFLLPSLTETFYVLGISKNVSLWVSMLLVLFSCDVL